MPPPLKAASGFGISYRRFSDDDLPFVTDLYASTRREEVAMTGWPADFQEQFLAQQAAAQHSHYSIHFADAEWLIIERDGEAIGRLYLRETADDLHIIDIALLPDSRGRGLGGAILEDVLDQARGLGRAVTIHVERNNPARSLYERLGFEVVEEGDVYDLLRARP
jgi:ribosomal protein S18 acetylase RimI-like enzyme